MRTHITQHPDTKVNNEEFRKTSVDSHGQIAVVALIQSLSLPYLDSIQFEPVYSHDSKTVKRLRDEAVYVKTVGRTLTVRALLSTL